ncbi:MAG: TonB-dependent receptor [Parabacteroides sp.]|nr:TonB-dependent receptor [Parabacteroides sp.]
MKNIRNIGYVNIKFLRLACLTAFLTSCPAIVMNMSAVMPPEVLTVHLQDKTLGEVFSYIENHSNYLFIYQGSKVDLNQKVDVNMTNKSVDEILREIFSNSDFKYVIKGRQIIVKKAEYSNSRPEPISLQRDIRNVMIRGSVADSNGSPLVGVNIVVKGTTRGTVTDSNGNFELSVVPTATLECSYIGYKTQILKVKNNLKVILLEDNALLDEVVVVGYGTMKKSDLTGSVTSVASKSFIDQPNSSVNSILSGRAPGVTVRRMNGAPGKGNTIRIRGANSLYGGNDPLIVVDGNYEDMPDTYDIESIEILKDASATAIYGSRGANGVILVTTRRGQEGKPTLKFYSNFSFDTVPQRYDLMNAGEFAEYNNSVGAYNFTSDEIAKYKANGGTDWQDQIFRTGLSQNYKAVISGGSKNAKYYVSPSYSKMDGTIKNTNSESYGLNAKIDMDLSSRVSVQFESNVNHNNNLNADMAQGGGKTAMPILAALLWAPTEPLYEEDGTTLNRLGNMTGTLLNPLLLTTVENTNYNNSGNGIGNLKIKIIDGLELNAKGSVSFSTGGSRDFQSKNYNGITATASQNSYENKSWLVNAYLTYNKTFAKVHNFSAMAGMEETQSKYNSLSGSANALSIESVKWYNLGLAAPNISVGSGFSNSALRSYFGRVNYNYASRYFVTVNFRSDGSSKFREGNQFGYFPSFSLAWKLTEEKFMKNQNIFSNVKIRGGWGETGNQAIDSYATYNTLGSRGYSWGTSSDQAGYFARVGGNPNLKWETTRQTNLGLDLGFFNNRLSVSLDYYNKKTVDLLAPVSVPAYNGADSEYGKSTVISNVGSVRNRGFEFNINYNWPLSKDLQYEVNFNGAINHNKVLDLGESKIIYGENYGSGITALSPFVLLPGQPIGTIYGLKYLGIWQKSEAAEAAKFGQTPGDYKYEDVNGDHSYSSDDSKVIGHTNPKFTWGLNNHLTYKDFDLNILFEGIHGRDIINWTYMLTSERLDISQVYKLRDSRDRWNESNPEAKFAKIGNTNKLNPISSQYMEDGSYVKLRNISLGYHVPKVVCPFADIKLSVSAQNILTFTKYKGYDPEISSSAGSDINAGMDWFAYPNPKSVSFGVSLTY